MRRFLLPAALTCSTAMAALIASCSTVPPRPVLELGEQEARGFAFAKAHCAGCHGISPNASSPNPEAPLFEAIANREGLTARTLETFLRDSHNFPGQMAFEIDPAKVDDVTAYMVTLRRADFHPAP